MYLAVQIKIIKFPDKEQTNLAIFSNFSKLDKKLYFDKRKKGNFFLLPIMRQKVSMLNN